jgi:transposase
LWEEYRAAHPEGYGYSRFCHHYQRWKPERDMVLRQEHRPGEKLFVDWAGATIPVYDPETGEVHPASLFVAVLGASNYTYAEANRDQQMVSWIGAYVRTFEFLGGCPQLVVPDNTKTGVTKACRSAAGCGSASRFDSRKSERRLPADVVQLVFSEAV